MNREKQTDKMITRDEVMQQLADGTMSPEKADRILKLLEKYKKHSRCSNMFLCAFMLAITSTALCLYGLFTKMSFQPLFLIPLALGFILAKVAEYHSPSHH